MKITLSKVVRFLLCTAIVATMTFSFVASVQPIMAEPTQPAECCHIAPFGDGWPPVDCDITQRAD